MNFGRKEKKGIRKSDIYADIFDSVKESVEMKNIFKDFMEVKTCIQFLLSEEQYAAIKKCGRNLPDQRLLRMGKNNLMEGRDCEL